MDEEIESFRRLRESRSEVGPSGNMAKQPKAISHGNQAIQKRFPTTFRNKTNTKLALLTDDIIRTDLEKMSEAVRIASKKRKLSPLFQQSHERSRDVHKTEMKLASHEIPQSCAFPERTCDDDSDSEKANTFFFNIEQEGKHIVSQPKPSSMLEESDAQKDKDTFGARNEEMDRTFIVQQILSLSKNVTEGFEMILVKLKLQIKPF